jgi:hypothetical protein
MEVTHNHNAKSQLAKLLASENITVQHKADAKTAWFDVKNRILCLPIWREMSNDLYDLLVVHEVGHALDTPPDGWLDAIQAIAKRAHGSVSNRALGAVKGFLNVIEDARIDKRQKRRFPGARRNYVKGYQELIEKNFFGTATRDVNSMSFIDRLNIYCKGGAMLGIKFSAEEKKMLAKVEAAETFDEVLALTEEIYGWSKENMQEQEQPPGDFGESDDDSEGDEDSDDYDYDWDDSDSDEDSEDGEAGDDSDSDEDSEDDESGETDGEGDEESDEDSEDDAEGDADSEDNNDGDIEDGAAKSEQDKDGDDSSTDSDDDIPESETEKAWQKAQEDLVLNSNHEYVYVKIPRPVNLEKIMIDFKQVLLQQREALVRYSSNGWLQSVRDELQKFKTAETATISFMVKEFEMRKSADEHSRTSVSKTGVIDTNKLHSYKYNDDLFRRFTSVATGKNHGFVMFVDWSGSMDYNLKKTLKQLFSLAMFCKRVQIPFEVYSFRSINAQDINKGRIGEHEKLFTANENELEFDNMFVRNILSSRMNVAELNEAMFNLYAIASGARLDCDTLGSTPLNECIGVADLIVNRFRKQSKVQIVNTIFLTDGQSDGIYRIHKLGDSIKSRKYILQDEVTKKSYDIVGDNSGFGAAPYSDKSMTTLLLKVLKDRTGSNLIGFYICGDGFDYVYRTYYGYNYNDHYTVNKKAFTTDGWFPVMTGGYDEYYILNPKFFDVSTGKLSVNSDMTKNRVAKEFIKFSEKKSVSRVLLTRFVKRIAA